MEKREPNRTPYQKPILEQYQDWVVTTGAGISRGIEMPEDFDNELFDNN